MVPYTFKFIMTLYSFIWTMGVILVSNCIHSHFWCIIVPGILKLHKNFIPYSLFYQRIHVRVSIHSNNKNFLYTKKNKCNFYFKGIGGGKSLFSQLDLILKSFTQATRCFLKISKIKSNFWDTGDQSRWLQQVPNGRSKLKLRISWNH